MDTKMTITKDSELLRALDLSEAQAADYLGKVRQTVNNALALDDARDEPKPYFKPGELFTLISVALKRGTVFNKNVVRQYVETSRKKRKGERGQELVLSLLVDQVIDLSGAEKIDIMLPGYLDSSDAHKIIVQLFQDHVAVFRNGGGRQVRCLTDSSKGKEWIEKDFDFPSGICKFDSAAEHYFALLFVYHEGDSVPDAYMATTNQGFVQAPQYRVRSSADCFDKAFVSQSLVLLDDDQEQYGVGG